MEINSSFVAHYCIHDISHSHVTVGWVNSLVIALCCTKEYLWEELVLRECDCGVLAAVHLTVMSRGREELRGGPRMAVIHHIFTKLQGFKLK